MNGFVKNFKILEETYKTDDLLEVSTIERALLDKLLKIENSSTFGLVGKFGSGKSTSLHHLSKSDELMATKWIQFDAWKYPDRKDLWEGLILDFADQIGIKKQVRKQINEGSTNSKYVDIVTDIIGSFKNIPGLEIIDKVFKSVFDKSPATKTFQLQEIFKNLINKQKEDKILIVVEDIDRSGDSGIYFLETLKNFIQTKELEKTVIAIVPISDKSYYENIDAYLKCLDFIEYFVPKQYNFNKFALAILSDDAVKSALLPRNQAQQNYSVTQVGSFLEGLIISYPEMTLRTIKAILRKANLIYISQQEANLSPDFRVTICVEAMKYVKSSGSVYKNLFDEVLANRKLSSNGVFGAFLASILFNEQSVFNYRDPSKKELLDGRIPFKLIDRKGTDGVMRYPSIPYETDAWHNEEKFFGLVSFYFNY